MLDWGLAKRVGPDRERRLTGRATPVEDPAAAAAPAAIDRSCWVRRPARCRLSSTDADTLRVLGSRFRPRFGIQITDRRTPWLTASLPRRRRGQKVTRESGAGPEGTMQGQLLGTPAYMAPEQARGEHDRVDQRTDIYGLGAILYEVLTGVPPFVAPKTAEIIRKVCNEDPDAAREIVPQVGPALEAVCLKALSKDPAGRYATATELAQEVQRYVADEPVNAYPEPWTRKVLRWARRHKVAVSTAAGLLVDRDRRPGHQHGVDRS